MCVDVPSFADVAGLFTVMVITPDDVLAPDAETVLSVDVAETLVTENPLSFAPLIVTVPVKVLLPPVKI